MRYQDWDILMFPEDSKVPMQEFDTKCHVLPVPVDRLPSQTLIDATAKDFGSSVTLVPVLTCFIASLESGQPFRVSIHSWDHPKPSILLTNFKKVTNSIAFDSKLFIDGIFVIQKFLGLNKTWPEVIDTTDPTSTEYTTQLRFPKFHPEILRQAHTGEAEGFGCIKIIISEGIAQLNERGEMQKYHRLRDIVAFSFHHAPRHILEQTEIAWPNPIMFQKSEILKPRYDSGAHSHSPIKQNSFIDDPFIGPRKGPSDISMEDLA